MPIISTIERARRDAEKGKAPSTQAGEFVREEIRRIRKGAHGARSAGQVIAIALSLARRAGIDLPALDGKRSRAKLFAGKRRAGRKPSPGRSRATIRALRRESRAAASARSLSLHARAAARRRGPGSRSKAAIRAARTRALIGG